MLCIKEKSGKKRYVKEHALAEKIEQLISEATNKARNLSKGLCPAELVAHGLASALRELCRKVESFPRVSCLFEPGKNILLEKERDAHIYYIVQEAVYNAVKHARPTKIVITLSEENNTPFIRIQDDGIGMKKNFASKGVGMRIMAHRAEKANASISWDSLDTRGTAVNILLNTS
ncbi:MAG: ATP-binding protein [Thermodesulfobacteriota bacterium]|nr:ATP-binding protein [Thermodesulfobacteriota bacterium]